MIWEQPSHSLDNIKSMHIQNHQIYPNLKTHEYYTGVTIMVSPIKIVTYTGISTISQTMSKPKVNLTYT